MYTDCVCLNVLYSFEYKIYIIIILALGVGSVGLFFVKNQDLYLFRLFFRSFQEVLKMFAKLELRHKKMPAAREKL